MFVSITTVLCAIRGLDIRVDNHIVKDPNSSQASNSHFDVYRLFSSPDSDC